MRGRAERFCFVMTVSALLGLAALVRFGDFEWSANPEEGRRFSVVAGSRLRFDDHGVTPYGITLLWQVDAARGASFRRIGPIEYGVLPPGWHARNRQVTPSGHPHGFVATTDHAHLYLIAAAIALSLWPALRLAGRKIQRNRRIMRGCCGECGYDVRMNDTGACPECGATTQRTGT